MLQSAYSRHGRLEGPAGVPVMTVDKPMFEVCQVLGQIQASVLPSSALKIEHAKVCLLGNLASFARAEAATPLYRFM